MRFSWRIHKAKWQNFGQKETRVIHRHKFQCVSLITVGDRAHNAKKTLCYVSRGNVKCLQSLCILNKEKKLGHYVKKEVQTFLVTLLCVTAISCASSDVLEPSLILSYTYVVETSKQDLTKPSSGLHSWLRTLASLLQQSSRHAHCPLHQEVSKWQMFHSSLQLFTANTDRHSVVYHRFIRRIAAVFVRVHPKTWYGWISMRIEFFGCSGRTPLTRRFPLDMCSTFLLEEKLRIQGYALTYKCGLSLLKKGKRQKSVPRVRFELTTFRFLLQIMRLTRCLLR